ncbi:Lysine-specific demethylase JMJ21 [Linum perenne]
MTKGLIRMVIASILELLTPRDVASLTCVSSVMYILCNEEPLWMSLCLSKAIGQMQYICSWKKTTLHLENVEDKGAFDDAIPHTTLNSFTFDGGNVERKKKILLEEFHHQYDGKKLYNFEGRYDLVQFVKIF